jgi:hypothetical protein
MEKQDRSPADRATVRLGLLLLQRDFCGMNIKAEIAADMAALKRDLE